jgi:hypothetical protein
MCCLAASSVLSIMTAPFILVLINLEIGNRSIPAMRRELMHYFEDPFVYSVVGIKMFTTPGAYLTTYTINLI